MLPGITPSLIVGGGPSITQLARSLRLNQVDNARLSRTFAGTFTDQKKGTIKFSVKLGLVNNATDRSVVGGYDGSSPNAANCWFGSGYGFWFQIGGSAGYNINLTGTYRDHVWRQFVCGWDTTQAVAADRLTVDVDGVRQTIASSSYPPLNYANANFFLNNANNFIGSNYNAAQHYDGYLADFVYVDGAKKTAADFGILVNGVWRPKDYVGPFGNKGFRLKFDSPTTPTTGGNDANTKALISLDGSLVDTSASPFAPSLGGSGSSYDTTNKKFGSSSLRFPTAGGINLITSKLLFSAGQPWSFDFWCKGVSLPQVTTNYTITFCPFYITGGLLYASTNGSSWNYIAGNATGWTPNPHEFSHYYCDYDGAGYIRCYKDGLLTGTPATAYNVATHQNWAIGGAANVWNFIGNLDEIRFSNARRWTGPFVPPTAPYSAGTFVQEPGGIHYDSSGNNNHWTPINLSTSPGPNNDNLVDTPNIPGYGVDTGLGGEVHTNYAVFNDNDRGNIYVRNGGLDLVGAVANAWHSARVTLPVPGTGHWWCEFTCINACTYLMLGVSDMAYARPVGYPGDGVGSVSYYSLDGKRWHNNAGVSWGAAYGINDQVGIRIDNGSIYFYKRTASLGEWVLQGGGAAVTGWTGSLAICAAFYDGWTVSANFGQQPWATALPVAGALAINAVNLIPPPAASFTVTAPATATFNAPMNFTVQAKTAGGVNTTNYSGTVHITSTDPSAILPADATLTNGVGTFAVTFPAVGGPFTVTATDTVTSSITGTSGNITVNATPTGAVYYLTSGSSWTVPADWDSSRNSIECIGGGGNGGTAAGQTGGGGGGGAYAKRTHITLTPSSSVAYAIGGAGGATWFNGTAGAGNNSCQANGGGSGVAGGAGAGGAVVNGTGFSGGNGGTTSGFSGQAGGPGGGGAGGPSGAGVAGTGSTGGSAGGKAGGAGSAGAGGAGAGESGTGGTGTNLGGGTGSGGGGGGGSTTGSAGGTGGLYGGGGGGGGGNNFPRSEDNPDPQVANGPGGAGRQGLIIIKYGFAAPV
jgi:hypothetical protein